MKLLIAGLMLLTTSAFVLQPDPTVIFSDRVEVLSTELRDIAPPVFEPTATIIPVDVIPEIQPTSNPCVKISNASELLCYPEYEDQNYGYFRELAADGKTATVVRYNPLTQEREALYSGEIEHILWVQNGYAALMIGSRGRVYVIPGDLPNASPISAGLALNIIDLASQQVIYSTPAQWYGPQSTIWTPNVFFVTPDWLHIDRRYYSDVNQVGAAKNSLVHLRTYEVVELDGQLSRAALGNDWYVLMPPGNFEFLTLISFYNLKTHEMMPIVNIEGQPNASVGLHPLPNNEFQITVQEATPENPYQPIRETVYVVRIQGVETS